MLKAQKVNVEYRITKLHAMIISVDDNSLSSKSWQHIAQCSEIQNLKGLHSYNVVVSKCVVACLMLLLLLPPSCLFPLQTAS